VIQNTRYQTEASGYAKQLRALMTSGEPTDTATRSASTSIESMNSISDKLPEILQQAGTLASDILDSGSAPEQEAAELRLLAQAEAEIKLARGLLETAHAAKDGAALDETTTRGGSVDIQESMNQIVALLDKPLGAEFTTIETRGLQDRPHDINGAKTDLKSEAERSLRSISKQATRVSTEAVKALVATDPATLKKGLAGFSQDAADLVDKVVETVSVYVRKILQLAMRLLVQAHEWVLKILGKDLEKRARTQIGSWLENFVKGEDKEATFAESLIETIFSVKGVKADADLWLNDTTAPAEQINNAAESIQSLAEKYKTKSETVEKFLKGIGLIKVVPIVAKVPQIQLLIAGVTACLLGYIIYTGYDHVDSGRVAFLDRFGVEIPDRVKGVRATLEAALVAKGQA
jgi:hypothetical protein